jgi:hypothetical protein
MLLCFRTEPAPQSPLGTLVAHLEACAAQDSAVALA